MNNNQSTSILEKVMDAEHERERQTMNPQEIIIQFFKQLASKEADVLKRRFALAGAGTKETLEEIGSAYHVTRERIRQIEASSIQKIRSFPRFQQIIAPFEHIVSTILHEHGGIMSERMLLSKTLREGLDSPENRKGSSFLLHEILCERLHSLQESRETHLSWMVNQSVFHFWKDSFSVIRGLIELHGKPCAIESLMEKFMEHEFYQKTSDRHSHDTVIAVMSVSKEIAKNPFSEYGLSSWGSIVPRRMNDKIMLILQKEQKPLHFRDIAKRISEVFGKTAYPPTVHNELILNKEYVLIGRGVYALKSWGYRSGIVADVIEETIRQANRPMTRQEIIDAVLKQRLVKKNTIQLALTNRDRFQKTENGTYTLAQTKEK